MAALHKSQVSLRFFGDDLDPAAMTSTLGVEPTVGVVKGGAWYTSKGSPMVAKKGSWRLRRPRQTPGDLDFQIATLLSSLSDDLEAWRRLTTQFDADLFCGLFMKELNEGLTLHPQTLLSVGARGLRLDLDLYAPGLE